MLSELFCPPGTLNSRMFLLQDTQRLLCLGSPEDNTQFPARGWRKPRWLQQKECQLSFCRVPAHGYTVSVHPHWGRFPRDWSPSVLLAHRRADDAGYTETVGHRLVFTWPLVGWTIEPLQTRRLRGHEGRDGAAINWWGHLLFLGCRGRYIQVSPHLLSRTTNVGLDGDLYRTGHRIEGFLNLGTYR